MEIILAVGIPVLAFVLVLLVLRLFTWSIDAYNAYRLRMADRAIEKLRRRYGGKGE